MKAIAIHFLVILPFYFLSQVSYPKLQALNQESRNSLDTEEQLYLPNGKGLRLISLGYHNFLADILWFNTINYFGKHYASDHDYRWLTHMCDLVTNLDPRAMHVYEFGALMLAWEANDPIQANLILTKAINTPELGIHPKLWKMYYLRGFNYTFFFNDSEKAAADFAAGSKLPNADVIMKRLASKKLLTLGKDPDRAVAFLREALDTTTDPMARKALERRLQEAMAKRAEILGKGGNE